MKVPTTTLQTIEQVIEMKKYFDKLFKAVKQDGAFFFILVTLNLPIIFQAFVENLTFLPSTEKFFMYVKYFGFIATILFWLTIAINFFLDKRKKLKKFLQQILIAVFSILFAAEFFYLSKFQTSFNVNILEIFLENLFSPAVLIGVIFFVILLIIGVQDLRKIFKSMSTKKVRRITYLMIIISLFAIFLAIT